MPNRIHAPVDLMQSPRFGAFANCACAQARGAKLVKGDNAVLPLGQCGNYAIRLHSSP
jgi:hypothetical protein